MTPAQAAAAVERFDCPTCGITAGSPCRTPGGNTAIKYHTPRFLQVPALRDALEVDVPADRTPGRPWRPGPALAVLRIGYAHRATGSADLDVQHGALRAAGCDRIFSEEVAASVKARPERERALLLARDLMAATPGRVVIVTVHELRRLARDAAELMSVAAELAAGDVRLEMLTGPLTGIFDPNGTGSLLFAVLAEAARLDRDHVREKSAEGRRAAAARGRPGGRPRVFDDHMIATARALRDQGVPVPEIAERLSITTGKNTGRHPSVASVYRALAEPEDPTADAADAAAERSHG
jgi:DNA invertase Pin-like site-specific DNA recombinase